MFKNFRTRLTAIFITALLTSLSMAGEIDKLNFLIPSGVGGGWDKTARGVGGVLFKEKIVDKFRSKIYPGEAAL